MFEEIVEGQSGEFILSNGTLIKAFELEILDQETCGIDACEQAISDLIQDLAENITLKIYLTSELSKEDTGDHSRNMPLSHVGFIKNRIFIIFEKYPDLDLSLFKANKNQEFSCHIPDRFIPRVLKENELEEIFPKLQKEIFHKFQTIDTGQELLSLIRLQKQSEFGIGIASLSDIKDTLPLPYTLYCAVQKVSAAQAETLLRRRSKQSSLENDVKESRKYFEAQKDLEDISLNGAKLFRFEWLCLLNRSDDQELRTDREIAKRNLQSVGEASIESVGALRSLRSLFPGTKPHFTLLEKDDCMTCYIPVMTKGENVFSKKNLSKSSVLIHRDDESLASLNIFNPKYESFSWCIFGRPGTGKSVITNAITKALYFDPGVKIIKIDVGGSHSRETKALGGVERTLSLNEPTGLNPFMILTELGASKEAIQILSNFLEVLILEEGESKVAKGIKADIERFLFQYSDSVKHNFSLKGFYNFNESFPRRNLLSRWIGDGVYGNAFSDSGIAQGLAQLNTKEENRLTYYNFSKISQAVDPDYAQGGLAAVMAQFNLEMLRNEYDKKKIVFIADETPFFIKKCFNFFNLSIANVRKEGHGFITIAQKSAHAVVDNDTGILDNSPNKIFFSFDGEENDFMARNQLSIEALNKIKSLSGKQGEYSECLLKDNLGERKLKVRLSPLEYWSYTSKDEDKRKLSELQKACPSISNEELIRCLAIQ